MTTPVTPTPAVNYIVATGGAAVEIFAANPSGGLMVNSPSASDQAVSPAEDVFINPVTTATLAGNGTTFRIPPGGFWNAIPGQTTMTSLNAATSGHKVSAIQW